MAGVGLSSRSESTIAQFGGRYAWISWLLLVLSLGLVYSPTLSHPFHYDDLHSVVENPHIRGLGGAVSLLNPDAFSVDPERGMFRPLVVLSHQINYEIGRLDPRGYHVVNVLLHLICVGVVGWLAVTTRLARHAVPAAALFGLHPLTVEVAAYVSARSESLATIGLFLALGLFIGSRRQGRKAGWTTGAVVAMAVGMLAKATAITSVALMGLWELRGRRQFLVLAPFVLIALAYLLKIQSALGDAVGDPVRSMGSQLMTQMKALVYYLQLMLMPTNLSVEHAFSESQVIEPTVLFSGLLLISIGLVVWRRASTLWQVTCLGALVVLTPSTLVPLNVLVNDHRLYPVLGLLAPVLTGSGTSIARGATRRLACLFLVWVSLLGILSAQRVDVWSTGLSLWQDAVAKAPGMYRAHLHLADRQEQIGGLESALPVFEQALALAPDHEQTNYNLARALVAVGEADAAIAYYKRSLEVGPGFAQAAINLAVLQDSLGHRDEALEALNRILAVRKGNAELYRRRALVHRGLSDDTSAEADLRSALASDPVDVESHFSLANLLFDLGRVSEAIEHYQRVIQLDPTHQGAVYNLADLALRHGNPAFAQQVGEAALLVGPVQGKLYYLLALAHEQQGRSKQAIANYRRFLQSWTVPAAVQQVVQQKITQLSGPDS